MNYVLYRDPVLSVGISVSNIEKSVLYWKDLLGMQVVQVRVRPLSEYIFGLCVILYPINVKINQTQIVVTQLTAYEGKNLWKSELS